jgi:hypothetical protein
MSIERPCELDVAGGDVYQSGAEMDRFRVQYAQPSQSPLDLFCVSDTRSKYICLKSYEHANFAMNER